MTGEALLAGLPLWLGAFQPRLVIDRPEVA
jgi:hypothetical protein